MGVVGADPESVRSTGRQLAGVAQRLDAVTAELSAALIQAPWRGPSADRFRAEWNSRYRSALAAAAAHLRDGQTLLEQNAAQQDRTSAADGGPTRGSGVFVAGGRSSGAGVPLPSAMAALIAMGPLSQWLLDKANFAAGVPEMRRLSRVLTQYNEIHASLFGSPTGLAKLFAGPGALQWIKAGSHQIPYGDAALTALDVGLNWHEKGFTNIETQQALALGGTGTALTFANPLLGLAWTAGTTTGQLITDHTQLDEWMADSTFKNAYGGREIDVPQPSAQWYQNANPEQLAAHSQRAAAASVAAADIGARAHKPWLLAWDVARNSTPGDLITNARQSLLD